jgi:hypothetical protein
MIKYQIVGNLKIKSQGVEQVIPAGTVITLSEAQAARLVKAGKVFPLRLSEKDVSTPAPKPFLEAEDDLVIPVEADSRYHWWNGGQPISVTLRELYEERAAIREFEGGQSKEEAEIGARVDIQRILDEER